MSPVRRVTGFFDRSRLTLRLGPTFLLCFLATCLVGCSSEAKKWETVRQTDVIQEYEAFVQKYPDGEHVAEARERLAALMESRDWRKAETEDSVEALRSFLQAYPSSLRRPQTETRLEALRWESALATNSIAGFEAYLKEYPQGTFASEASARISEMRPIRGRLFALMSLGGYDARRLSSPILTLEVGKRSYVLELSADTELIGIESKDTNLVWNLGHLYEANGRVESSGSNTTLHVTRIRHVGEVP